MVLAVNPSLVSFLDELEKIAAIPAEPQPRRKMSPGVRKALTVGAGVAGLGAATYFGVPRMYHGIRGGVLTANKALSSPRSAANLLGEGWRSMRGASPMAMEGKSGIRAAYDKAGKEGVKPGAISKMLGKKELTGAEAQQRMLARQGHLVKVDPATGNLVAREGTSLQEAYKNKDLINELSRRGWLGAGKGPGGVTKYLPGMKPWMAGFPLALAPSELKKGDPEFTGMGRAERGGKMVGETAGYIAGWPIGMATAAGGGVMANKGLTQLAKGTGRWSGAARWMSKGQRGLVPMMVASSIMGGLGGAVGRAAGRPVDLVTGERQHAKAKKGLKTYLEHRQAQTLKAQRRASQMAAY